MITQRRTWKSFLNLIKQQCRSIRHFNSFHYEHHLFDKMLTPNIFYLRQSMITCLRENRYREALTIFKECAVCSSTGNVDEAILSMALKSCQGDQILGSQIHGYVTTSGFSSWLSVSNSLISMYNKGGRFDQSLYLFHNLQNPDVVSWNAMLSGFKNQDGIDFACEMHKSGVVFDAVTYSTVLALCADHGEFFFHFGIQLHSAVFKSGLFSEVFIGNALITMYSKEGKIIEAEKVFDEMPQKDLVSWNAVLSGYAQEGVYGVEAILIFNKMLKQGMHLDHVSFTSVVSACGIEKNLQLGTQVHNLIIKKGYCRHISVCNVLLSMYSKCDQFGDVKLAFADTIYRNVISWTTMISIDEEHAMILFNQMRLDGVYPNNVTFVALIHAITNHNSVEQGRTVHCLTTKTNFFNEPNVANCLITMYAKFKTTDDSRKIFDELLLKGIVSWNALISAYAQNNQSKEAVETFLSAKLYVNPNEYTLGSVLNAIAAAEAVSLRHGQRCHSYLFKVGFDSNSIVSGALLDMYAKRGSIHESRKVFNEMIDRSQVAWTAIISANSRHGDYKSVLTLFNEMITTAGVKPDPITFLSILTACGRNGMVDKGLEVFNSMTVEPLEEHYACMVDMLGRAGRLKEAEEFASLIPGKIGISTLQCLLGACRVHGNVEMGKRVGDALMEMEPKESGSYVLMSNLYAEKGEWEKVAKIRRRMRDGNVKKEIGFSWVDVDLDDSLQLHGFSSDDKLHPRSDDIYVMAKYLGSEMKFLRIEGTTNCFTNDDNIFTNDSTVLY
ncbi:pentatricopeptide repeat-containing protein At4g32430, mitochondrial [Impatiens glandulifera]|uniref:pentatricopeptide repeat-containing protein At4g32430, mitochondrial n=1 Tax=Impatiens glandulifera TaxID=253017 RepID=UPI001FB09ED7|nr:pentatricopeptide repeat-containing protein At4g32430, mitochondrial [Impatiens glandulifera]XP_047309880.1 pentatricopeptide repeat-containing protein At4g32430, mitochondrial [Impatiens glandulifera]